MGSDCVSKFPILYKGDAADFFTLGLGPIQMLKATVTQERNGIFIFEGEILTDSPLFPLVLENYLIKADADHLLKDQRFRIKRIVPNHNGKAEIYAEHVSYLSRELTIKPEVSITGSAQFALSQWKASIVESNPFVVDSDIPTSNKTKWRIDKVENPRMALGGVEGSILDRWGGEYRFDNYHISLLQKRGTTAKTVLAYGRNITDFEQERNIANTYTSIAPYAIYTDDKENEVVVHVDGYAVDSQHINKYPNRVTLPVDFSSEFGHDEIPTKARLLALANQYIKANEIGVPSTSIKVSFVDLSKSADYAEYAFLEQVNLCDDVRVYYPKLGVNTVAKVIRTVWNVLTESYDEIEIGQKRMSLVGQMQEQQKAIKEINTQTNFAMTSADGKNTIFHGLYGQDGLGEPVAIKIGDTWFKPNGTGTDILTWTGTVWQLVFDAKTFDDIGIKVDEMEQDIIDATEKAQEGLDKAEEAILKAGFANDAVEIAVEQSADAVTRAQQAQQSANDLLGQVTTIEGTLTTVESVIDELNGQMALKVNTIDFNTLTGIVNSHTTQIGVNSGQIALKANKDYVDTINNQVESVYSELTVQAGEITTLNSKTDGHTTQIGSLESSFSGLNITVATVKQDLDGLEIGGRNLLRNTNYEKQPQSWNGASITISKDKPNNYITVKRGGNSSFGVFSNDDCEIVAGETYTLSLEVRTVDVPNLNYIYIMSGEGNVILAPFNSIQTNGEWTYLKRTFISWFHRKKAGVMIGVEGATSGNEFSVRKLKLEKGNKATDWSPAPEDMATVTQFSSLEQTVNDIQTKVANKAEQSEVTQLAGQWSATVAKVDGHTGQISNLGEQINLRVKKDSLIGEINLQAGKTIFRQGDNVMMITPTTTFIQDATIKTAHIADLAVSGAKIANASITSAKIISLDASKVTANRLDVITANTGNLNVSGNLTMTTDNNVIKGAYVYGEAENTAYIPRYFIGDFELGRRYMAFTGDIYSATSSGGQGAFQNYSETYFGLDYFKMRNFDNRTSGRVLRSRIDMRNGQIEISDTWGQSNLGEKTTLAYNYINAQNVYAHDFLHTNRIIPHRGFATFQINPDRLNNIPILILSNAADGFAISPGSSIHAGFNVGSDGAPRIWSAAFSDRTYSAAANMHVTAQGTIGRAVSARKYKTDITKEKLRNAKDVLKIMPSSWLDKIEVSKGKIKQRYYGFIADEFHEIGLTEVVQYGIYGDVEGLDYDHISMYHNVILSDHEKEIIDLKQKVSELEKQVRVLQMAS